MVEFRQSTQKMRTDLAKTLDSELELHDPEFMSYALHYVYQSVEGISLRREKGGGSDNPAKRTARTLRRR